MTREEYIRLYEKYMAGDCTEAEKNDIEAYISELDLAEFPWNPESMGDEQAFKNRVYNRLSSSIARPAKYRLWRRILAAAVTLLVVGTTIYLYRHLLPGSGQRAGMLTENIQPGTNKAILTLADGSTVILDKSGNGPVASQGLVEIVRNDNGEIVYEEGGGKPEAAYAQNMISTPRGAETQVVLSDGTKIWLNAASSVRFPVAFSGTRRKIELTGEAYLEVAEDKSMPFVVAVRDREIEVLGTRFNVNAYEDRADVTTTLLQGSVRLKAHNRQVVLRPGQQGVAGDDGKLNVQPAALANAVAWKNGLFVFNGENIRDIMADVARWYDLEVDYVGSTEGKNFDAKMNRSDDIRELLKNMELTGMVRFKIQGRRVTVMAK
ncbi:FecR family protein [Pedobacter yulinensis]|nr:FecR family protein [Pedobacter yulinensis]